MSAELCGEGCQENRILTRCRVVHACTSQKEEKRVPPNPGADVLGDAAVEFGLAKG